MNQYMKRVFVWVLAVVAGCAQAQQLTYHGFMSQVMERNHALQSARHGMDAAEAECQASRKVANPVLSAEYGNNSDWNMLMGQSASVELSQSISFVRTARIRGAQHGLEAAQAAFRHNLLQLKAEAAQAYLTALLQRELTDIMRQTEQTLTELLRADSIRLTRGDIAPVDLMQTRLETGMARQEVRTAETDYRNALVQLDLMMGQPTRGTQTVRGNLSLPQVELELSVLMDSAKTRRADLAEARLLSLVAKDESMLLKRERIPEMEVALGASYNTRVRNEEAPAPEFMGYTIGLSIPLPVANMNTGEIRAGQHRVAQTEEDQRELEDQVVGEVITAYNNYQSALSKARQFDAQFIDDARQVWEGRLYAYRRGESSLLEVIEAQRTYNDVRRAYAESLHECQCALVDLKRVAALDIDLEMGE